MVLVAVVAQPLADVLLLMLPGTAGLKLPAALKAIGHLA